MLDLFRQQHALNVFMFVVIFNYFSNEKSNKLDTMSWRPFTTFEDFSKAKQDFDQIPTIHISYAFSYFSLLQCNLVEHPIVDIWEDLDTPRFF
jgi:hypothetical protein